MTKTLKDKITRLKELADQKTTKELSDSEFWLIKGESNAAKDALEIISEILKQEERIVYLVAIIKKNTEYEDVKNYLFESREDAVNLIEKHYYLKSVKNSPRKWKNPENDINAILTELFIR